MEIGWLGFFFLLFWFGDDHGYFYRRPGPLQAFFRGVFDVCFVNLDSDLDFWPFFPFFFSFSISLV